MTDTRYQGWTNRATWAWKLWMDNDQGSYERAMQLAQDCLEEARTEREGETAGTKAQREKAVRNDAAEALAAALKSDAEEAYDAVIPAGTVWRDLFDLDDIDFDEIAASYIEDAADA